MTTKNGQIMKMKTLASNARDDLFDKKDNKFQVSLSQARDLLDEWANDENKGLLTKLLEF